MKNFDLSEIFSSIEGEGPYTGHSTVYLRVSTCNLKCPKFNNPNNEVTEKGYAKLDFDPKEFDKLKDLPPITRGCDTQYSVNPTFSHLWTSSSAEEVAVSLTELLPNNSWITSITKKPIIFSITGGEPTMFQKQIPTLLNHPLMKDCKHILFETNCSIPLSNDFIASLNNWIDADNTRFITFSNSPKLSASGERWKKAIVPKVAADQCKIRNSEQYFKFVCGPKDEEFQEVLKAMEEYWEAGVPKTSSIYIMPQAIDKEQQQQISEQVAKKCIQYGLIYCHRVHLEVFSEQIGT